MTGMVFDIQHFCVDDGPGIRTTVFMKGCPLRCLWCHNPEGLSRAKQVSYDEDKCVDCRRCVAACERHAHQVVSGKHTLDRGICVRCGHCIEACPVEALRIFGQEMSVEEVLEDVCKDRLFYETSEGGVTLSGGEPFYQSEFTIALLKAAKAAGLHTCVETSGFCSEQVIREAAPFVDLFLLDIKETDPVRHKEFTGVDNGPILHNAELLSDLQKDMILRCPIIPGCNDREAHYQAIAGLANRLKTVREIHIEPYHPFGVDKYLNLGMEAGYDSREFMENDKAEEAVAVIRKYTEVEVKIS